MKTSLKITFSLLILFFTKAHSQEDYTIEINGESFEISLDKEFQFQTKDGVKNILLKQKDTLTYNDEMFSFNFFKEYKVGKTKIEQGIEQLMLMTPEGDGFLIQKYSTINPENLKELMLGEVTKESINYGFEMERREYNHKLTSGEDLNVIQAYLTYNDEVNIYEIASVGKKDSGLLIMAMRMNDTKNSIGEKLINLIWNSLEIK
ncbi:hypothetical protein [Dokdonia sp. LLG6352-1]|jgi:hypothetical protein|uniref:hypothetical protein n=1 Tax=Dokdonia sp. LLG6352-1 TaxID=3160831 RepID=UPI00386D8AB1